MPGLDGFGVLKKLLDKRVALPQIIFATAFDQYAVRAFEVNAVDYLLKPFDKKRVLQAVQKVRERRQSSAPAGQFETLVKMLAAQKPQPTSKLLIKSAGRLFLADQKDICFASIEDGVITVVTSALEGQSNCRTLEELLAALDPNLFWRAHRSYLVNINRIREVVPWFKSSYQLRMGDKNQTEIPVSRAQTKRLRELFGL
jgi:two-component system LytT family response regulator/two-component system response regulator LytT